MIKVKATQLPYRVTSLALYLLTMCSVTPINIINCLNLTYKKLNLI